jgi:hypothetical protein
MAWKDDRDDLATELAFWHVGQTDLYYPIEQLGELSCAQATKFRALAVMQLLSEGSTDLFLHNLMRAARTQRWFLARVHDEAFADLYFAASGRIEPLLDAIAADDFDCAREIASRSAPALQPGEYEDDHHYARALHALLRQPVDGSAAARSLDDMELFLSGEASPRLEVLRTIVRLDQVGFERAFEEFLRWFEEGIERARARAQLEDPVVLALREVSIEGLALLRLADRLGLRTDLEYPYCPALARRPLTVPLHEV